MEMLWSFLFPVIFLSRCLVAIFLGFVIGYQNKADRSLVRPFYMALMSLAVAVISFIGMQLSVAQGQSTMPLMLMAHIITSVALLSGAVLICSRSVQGGVSTALYLFLASIVGLLVGVGWLWTAVLMTGLVCLVVLFSDTVFSGDLSTQRYCVSVDIFKFQALEKIEAMIGLFRLSVIDKTLVRSRHIHLELRYDASPLMQHLFLKRLYRLKGLGTITKV